jgi:hypothetical protein
MERGMKTRTAKTKPPRPHRNFPDAIDEVLNGYGPRACVVQLWRQVDGIPNRWTYLGRLRPEQCQIELIARRFGGGWYRAKIFGPWDREQRREEYLEQVAFGIDQQWWPMTTETRERIREQHGL